MAEFKIVLSDQKTGRSYKVDVGGGAAGALIGKRIGDEVDASIFGLPGYRMEITGGSDRNGTPARRNLPFAGRRKILLVGWCRFQASEGRPEKEKEYSRQRDHCRFRTNQCARRQVWRKAARRNFRKTGSRGEEAIINFLVGIDPFLDRVLRWECSFQEERTRSLNAGRRS